MIRYKDIFDLNDSQDLDKAINVIKKLGDEYQRIINLAQKDLKKVVDTQKKLATSATEVQKAFKAKNSTVKDYATQAENLFKQDQALTGQQVRLTAAIQKLRKEKGNVASRSREIIKLQNDEIKLQQKLIGSNNKQAQSNQKLRVQISEKNKQMKQEARETLGLVSIYEKQSRELNDLRKAYKEVALQEGLNSKSAKKLRTQVEQLDNKLKKVDASAGQFQRSVGGYKQAFQGAVASVTAFAFAVTGIIRAVGRAIKVTREFEDANATLRGILNATRKETELLRDQQLALGKSTEFSATEVAKAQTELARLGQSQENIIAMTPGILAAATALGTDLAGAAELVAGQLNAFGLEASESQRVADVLTKSTQISALNFERLSTALGVVSPAAAAVGVTIEETTAILGAAVDANIDASTAATGLRNIYLDLADKGLTWEDAMNQINTSTNKLNTANQLFGKRGAVVAQVIANSTDKIEKNTAALNDAAGTAQEFADKQLETLSGKLKLLNSAWEGFILSVESGEGPIGRFFKAAVDGASWFIDLLSKANENLDELLEKQYKSLLSEEAQIEIKQLEEDFERLQKLGGKITIEEFAIQKIDDLVKGTQSLNNEFNTLTAELEQQERQLKDWGKYGFTGFAEKEELKESVIALTEQRKEIRTQIDLRNSSITALQKYIGQVQDGTKKENDFTDAVSDANKEIERQSINLSKLLSWQELEKKKLEELKALYEVVYGETVEESEQKAIDANQAFIDRIGKEITARGEQFKEDQENIEETETFWQRLARNVEFYGSIASDALNSITGIFENVQERRLLQLDQELEKIQANKQAIEDRYNLELQLAGDNEQAQEEIALRKQERLQIERENELRIQREIAIAERKQAVFAKANGIGQAIINTAVGVTSALATGNIPLSILVGVLGGLEVAAIASEPLPPLPQFFKGTDSAPAGDKIVGEKGSELVVTPKGKIKLSPNKATVVNDEFAPQGSKIIPAHDTQRILNEFKEAEERSNYDDFSNNNEFASRKVVANNSHDQFLSTLDSYLKKDNKRLDELAEMIEERILFNFEVSARGFEMSVAKGNNRINYLGQKYKRK